MFKGKPQPGNDDNIALVQDDLKRILDVQWWLWRHIFLRAKGLLLEQRNDDHASHQITIDGLLAQLSDEDRRTFEAAYRSRLDAEIRKSAANGDSDPDPDTIEAETLEALIRRTEGRDNAEGLGLVPSREGEYDIIPPESDPREIVPRNKKARGKTKGSGNAAGGEMTRQRKILLGVVCLLPFLWFIWTVAGSEPAVQATNTTTTPTVVPLGATPTAFQDYASGEDVTVFYPSSLEISRDDVTPLVYRVIASASALGGTWHPDTSAGQAAWLNGTYINHVFCLPEDARVHLGKLQRGDSIIMRPASGQARQYEIVRTRTVGRQQTEIMEQRRAGLTLIVCGIGDTNNTNNRLIAEAIYRPEQSATTTLRKGEQGQLSDLARFTIRDITTEAPNSTMPSGYSITTIQAQVENLSAAVLDSNDIVDQLQINGVLAERLPPQHSEIDAHAKRIVSYRYYVPAGGTTGTWQATAATGENLVYSVTIPAAPESALAAFSASIEQRQTKIRSEGDAQIIFMTVTIHANKDVALGSDMFTLWIGTRSQALTPQEPLPILLRAGEDTTITVAAQIVDVAQFEIEIGTQRWRVTLP